MLTCCSRIFQERSEMINGAVEMAALIASKSPVAVQGTKVNMVYSRDHSVQDGLNHVVCIKTIGIISTCHNICTVRSNPQTWWQTLQSALIVFKCFNISNHHKYMLWDKSKKSCPLGNWTLPNLVHYQSLETTWPVATWFPGPDNVPCLDMCDFPHGFL